MLLNLYRLSVHLPGMFRNVNFFVALVRFGHMFLGSING